MGGKIKSKTCPDNPNISLCGELFYGLEKYLAGNPGTYKYWEKVAENLEVDRLAYTTAQEIISALRETKQKYGIEVAQTLYNTHSVHYPREIVNAGRYFAKAKTLFEDSKYHNCVFVGTDDQGIPRHAHKRSANSFGKSFRQNVEGSDPRYSFHHLGTDGKLYVFEAPIDMLSFITMYPEDWKSHNYVACCGTSAIPVMSMLSRMHHAQEVFLCLDNDAAGQAASLRMAEQIAEQFGIASDRLTPKNKDWNDDLCVLEDAQVPFLETG